MLITFWFSLLPFDLPFPSYLYGMRPLFILLLIAFYITGFSQTDTTQKIVPGRYNSIEQQAKPYVILISADGFRADYIKHYHATYLDSLSKAGVRTKYMTPSFPSLTFPNHYTLITGLYPSHHGIVDNYFYDRARQTGFKRKNASQVADSSWYGGTPLWVLAEQQHLVTASYYWVGSEVAIRGVRPTYYYIYNESTPIDQRIETVKHWLQLPAETRPHFITFYLPEVDRQGHDYGPESSQTADAVQFIDSTIERLVAAVLSTGLTVNFIFVSDHGMTTIDTEHPVKMPVMDSSVYNNHGSELVQLYLKNKDSIQGLYARLRLAEVDYKTYLKDGLPARLHYGSADDRYQRTGDIYLVPNWPKTFESSTGKKLNPGAHGFDPGKVKDMRATFFCWGLAFRQHLKVKPFENVHIYPIITQLLGLTYSEAIDGKPYLAGQVLR